MANKQAIEAEIAETRRELGRKFALVEQRVEDTVGDIRRTFDPKTYVDKHPMAVVAGTVAAGVALGMGIRPKVKFNSKLWGKLAVVAWGALEGKVTDFARKEIPEWAPHIDKAVREITSHFHEPYTVDAVTRHEAPKE